MPDNKDKVIWSGSPEVFRTVHREDHGLLIGRYIYLFNTDGSMRSCVEAERNVVEVIIKNKYDNPGAAMAAHLRKVKKNE